MASKIKAIGHIKQTIKTICEEFDPTVIEPSVITKIVSDVNR